MDEIGCWVWKWFILLHYKNEEFWMCQSRDIPTGIGEKSQTFLEVMDQLKRSSGVP